jgi:hypothetical protein
MYPFYDKFDNGFVYRGTCSLYRDYYDYPYEEEEEEEDKAPEDYDDDVIEGGYYSFNLVKFLMR